MKIEKKNKSVIMGSVIALVLVAAMSVTATTVYENFNSNSATSQETWRQIYVDATDISAGSGDLVDDDRSDGGGNVYRLNAQWEYAQYSLSDSNARDGIYKLYFTCRTDKVGSLQVAVTIPPGNGGTKSVFYVNNEGYRCDTPYYFVTFLGYVDFYDSVDPHAIDIEIAESGYTLWLDEIILTTT
jgi:hypothetical protein